MFFTENEARISNKQTHFFVFIHDNELDNATLPCLRILLPVDKSFLRASETACVIQLPFKQTREMSANTNNQ